MSGFDERRRKGDELVSVVKNILKQKNIPYINSGYENLANTFGSDRIKFMKDNTSYFIRHYPDFSLILKESLLLEVKNSSGIEKQCYYNYLKLSTDLKLNVCVCFSVPANKNNPMYCDINELKFNIPDSYDAVSGVSIPITDIYFRTPRLLPDPEYYWYLECNKKNRKNTSGCSFAFIDFYKTKFKPIDSIDTYFNKHSETISATLFDY